MLPKTNKNQRQEKKQQLVSDGDQSISLQIQPQKKQMTAHTDFDIKYEEDQRKMVMYIELDPKNINNLTRQLSKIKQFEDERKLYKNCIFIKKIQTPQTHIKGNFRISFLHYKGLTFTVQLKSRATVTQMTEQQPEQFFAKMKMHIKGPQNWETRWVSCQLMDQSKEVFNFQITASQIEKILKEKLLIQIVFQKYPKLSKDYQGIQNQGNTCYANSTLQLLFHFLPLRKLIVELSSKKVKKLTKALQEIFIDLMTSKSTVRAQSLLNCFDKLGLIPHRQQDIHQFLISFFDQLENQLPQVAHFWTGKDFEVTSSKEVKYETKQQQNFTQLQLFMSDTKGNNFVSISQSLRQLLNEDMADQPIDTDQFGKIRVNKSRYFQSLPPLLFMNIKRYEYNAKRKQLKKINLDLTYPKEIKLDFLMKTPEDLNYILYAVVVHKGRTPNSGHYFCFVNVSKQVDNSTWYQFNDSTVKTVKQTKVLNNYTGKKKSEISLNQQYGKWVEKDQPSEETAYLLAYIRKDLFEDFQNLEVKIPSWHLQRLQQKLTQQQSKTMATVKIFILNNTNQFKPFDLSVELQQLKLIKSEPIESELKKFQKVLCCTIGTIWKVNCKTRTIKHIQKQYGQECKVTVGRHIEFKRGTRQPDYFMIIPLQKMREVEEFQKRQLGILHTSQLTEQQCSQKVQVLARQDILQKIQEMKSGSINVSYDMDQMQYFMEGWNGYLQIQKQ